VVLGCSDTMTMRVTVPTAAAAIISNSSMCGVRKRSTISRPEIGRQIVAKGGISATKRLAP
jgi:hypothetical protein